MWSKKLLRCMKAFYNYLLNKHLAVEKSAAYYVSWGNEGRNLLDKPD